MYYCYYESDRSFGICTEPPQALIDIGSADGPFDSLEEAREILVMQLEATANHYLNAARFGGGMNVVGRVTEEEVEGSFDPLYVVRAPDGAVLQKAHPESRIVQEGYLDGKLVAE